MVEVEAILYFREGDKVRSGESGSETDQDDRHGAVYEHVLVRQSVARRRFNDYRPEVHDTDGLLMQMGNGEVLWRPLNNPAQMSHQVFVATKDLGGFGLIQRDRNFSNYQDLFNAYYKTPSVWVRPNGAWGEGEIHLRGIAHDHTKGGQRCGVLEPEGTAAAAETVSSFPIRCCGGRTNRT